MNRMKINSNSLDFLKEWQERTKAQQKKGSIFFVLVILFVFAIGIGFFAWFQNANYDRIVQQNMNYIQDNTVQETNQFEREMQNGVKMVKNLASQYSNMEEMDDALSIKEHLTRLLDRTLFDRIAFISEDGTDTSQEGTANVANREYFQNGMRGKSGWEFVAKSRVTGKPTLVFYAPIIAKNKTIGVMAGFYEQDRISGMFYNNLFHYAPETYLLRGDGTVIANSKGEEIGSNKLKELSEKKFNGDTDYEVIQKVIRSAERTTITFNYREKSETYVGVIVQFKESDWMIYSLLPNEVTNRMVQNANRVGTVFIAVSVIAVLGAVAVIIILFRGMARRYAKNMNLAMKSIQDSITQERQQLAIVQSLANVYSSVYLVDNTTEEYRRLKEEDSSVLVIPDSGDWIDGAEAYCDKFVGEKHREQLKGFMKSCLNGFQDIDEKQFNLEYLRMDRKWRRGIVIPVEDEGESDNHLFVYAVQKIDAEKRKELETRQALEEAYEMANVANSAKTRFLSNMSHDIRTPMNAIVGMAAIASANLENPVKMADCLKKITISSKHLLGLINEVLDMSKIESGKVDLCEEEFSLSELVDSMISINMPLVNEKGHSLVVRVENVTHENVIGDSTRLQQILTNLLTNAIKYTPEKGRIEIVVSEKETKKATIGWYEVSVKDNGIGMSEEFVNRIFEPFARAEDDRINGIQGTGLGMAITRNIIRMMNGDIKVESRLNEGSTFTASFALQLPRENEIDYESFVDLPVLVVDDDVVACESTCTMLDSLKMNSEWVLSGKEAIVKMKDHHSRNEDYYAVILDWKMPDMDGVEVARQIRREIDEDIPIVILSAYDWSDIEEEAREAGVNAFISKPLFRSKLIDLFSGMVENEKNYEAGNSVDELSEYDFSGKRLLLVEDNEINREIVVELMSMIGFEIEAAENGKIAVDMFAASAAGYYNLILMDIQMPVMNGYEATRAIRALSHPDAAKVPIVAMTANAFSSDVRAAYDSGMDGHLAKPIEIKKVIQVLKEKIHMK